MIFNNWDNPVFDERNNIVFANRNTVYGAYQIRKDYNKNAIGAFLITSAAFVGILMAIWLPSVLGGGNQEEMNILSIDSVSVKIPVEPPPVEPPKIDPPKEPMIKTIAFVPPVVRSTAEDTTRIVTQEELEGQHIGGHTQGGTEEEEWTSTTFTTTVIEDNKAKDPFVYVTRMPEFPGGLKALYEYIGRNIVYPESAKEAGIEGKCYMRFVVTAEGKIGKIEIQKGVPGCPECDAEVKRVTKTLPEFAPGENNGEKVPVWFQLPVNFTLAH